MLSKTTSDSPDLQECDDMEVSIDELPLKTRDIAIQCCLEKKKILITKNTSTQTDSGVHEDSTIEKLNVLYDHSYCSVAPSVSIAVSPKNFVKSISPQESARSYGFSPFSSDDEDEECIILSQETHSSTDSEPGPVCSFADYLQQPKYLVFASCLNELFKFCMNCGLIVTEVTTVCTGSMLTVKTKCMNGHVSLWNSQPIVNRTWVGNLLLSSSILFTGNTYTRIQNYASCLGLKFISKIIFYQNQDRYLFPVKHDAWEREQRTAVEDLLSKSLIHLNWDGRCDNGKRGIHKMPW